MQRFNRPLENVAGGIMVAVQHKTAWTFMNTNRQILMNFLTAAGAFLACAVGIHGQEQNTSVFSFVFQLPEKLPPSGVRDALAQLPLSHAFDGQFFDGDQVVFGDHRLAQMVSEVPSGIGDLQMDSLQPSDRLSPGLAAFIFATDVAAGAAKFSFQFPIELGARHGASIRTVDERFQAHIEADRIIDGTNRSRNVGRADNQLCEPVLRPANDAKLFDIAEHGPKIATADCGREAANAETPLVDDASWIADGETVVAVSGLETGKARLSLAFFDSPEEMLKSKIDTMDGVSFHLKRDGPNDIFGCSPEGQDFSEVETGKSGLPVLPDAALESETAVENLPPYVEVMGKSIRLHP